VCQHSHQGKLHELKSWALDSCHTQNWGFVQFCCEESGPLPGRSWIQSFLVCAQPPLSCSHHRMILLDSDGVLTWVGQYNKRYAPCKNTTYYTLSGSMPSSPCNPPPFVIGMLAAMASNSLLILVISPSVCWRPIFVTCPPWGTIQQWFSFSCLFVWLPRELVSNAKQQQSNELQQIVANLLMSSLSALSLF
jgi:hypothetical protein